LTPGVYAVHWGALEGYTTTDSRMFLFRVGEAEPPPAEAQPTPEKPPEQTPASAPHEPPDIDTSAVDAEAQPPDDAAVSER
jgi:hypothetical protein